MYEIRYENEIASNLIQKMLFQSSEEFTKLIMLCQEELTNSEETNTIDN